MFKTIKVVFPVFLLLFLLSVNPAQGQIKVPEEAKVAAQKSLISYLKNFISKANYSKFGFKKYEDVQSARPGSALPERFIRLKDLQLFDPQTNPKNIIRDARTWWFPVYTKNYLATKIEIIRKNDRWIGGEFGGVRAAKIIETHRELLTNRIQNHEVQIPEKIILLKIPALAADLLFYENEEGFYIIPAMIQPQRFELENGKTYPAAELLLRLKGYAIKINPDKVY